MKLQLEIENNGCAICPHSDCSEIYCAEGFSDGVNQQRNSDQLVVDRLEKALEETWRLLLPHVVSTKDIHEDIEKALATIRAALQEG